MTVRAVLFDFSGTLASLEARDDWFAGTGLDGPQRAEVMDRMTHPTGGGLDMTDEMRHAWAHRDLVPRLHREAYRHVLRECGLGDEQAESLYRRCVDPASWVLYPDTAEVLDSLRANGIHTAVVSNIAWDIRSVLSQAGTDADHYVLSFEVGAAKPDLRIFEAALARVGVPAHDAVMVGDSEENDGAAQKLGCDFILVDPLPTEQRPTGLRDGLRERGIGVC